MKQLPFQEYYTYVLENSIKKDTCFQNAVKNSLNTCGIKFLKNDEILS